MKLTSLADWNCSIAKTLDVVGEWWTLLILRDAFGGTRRFDDFQASLGLARSVLTARLEKLTAHGILERRAYAQHPPRYEYHLTEKGRALFPVSTALLTWGDQWAPTAGGPPVLLVHDTCGNITVPVLTCPHCHTEVTAANTHGQPGPGSSGAGAGAPGPGAGPVADRAGQVTEAADQDGAGDGAERGADRAPRT